jgi:AcrR family transcriptional regulator
MQRNKAATLERVLQSSVQEFAQKGFHLARVSDIASMARCSTETIYDVFVSKEGLFTAVVQHVFEERFGEDGAIEALGVQVAAIKDPLERACAILTFYTAPQMDPTFLAIMYQVMASGNSAPNSSIAALYKRREQFKAWITDAFAKARDDGLIQFGNLDAASETALSSLGIMLGAKYQFFGPLMTPEAAFDAARSTLSAFATAKGLKRLASLAPIDGPFAA